MSIVTSINSYIRTINWQVALSGIGVYTIVMLIGYSISSYLTINDVCSILISIIFVTLLMDSYMNAFITSSVTGLLECFIYIGFNYYKHHIMNVYIAPLDWISFIIYLIMFLMITLFGVTIGFFINRYIRKDSRFKNFNTSINDNISNNSVNQNKFDVENSVYGKFLNNSNETNNEEYIEDIYCGYCGNKLSHNCVNFCTHCGKRL